MVKYSPEMYKLENFNQLTAHLLYELEEAKELISSRTDYKEWVYEEFLEGVRPMIKRLKALHAHFEQIQKVAA
jgi:hypothetical protein